MQNLSFPTVVLTTLAQWQRYHFSFLERISALHQASKISSTEHKMAEAYLDKLYLVFKKYFSLKTLPKQRKQLQILLDEIQILIAEKKIFAVTELLTELQTILKATRDQLLEPMDLKLLSPEILNKIASDNFTSRETLNLAQCSRLLFFGDAGLLFLAKSKKLLELGKFKLITKTNSCFLSLQNKLFVWGYNNCGQLGLGDDVVRYFPLEFDLTPLQLAPADGVAQVIAGGQHNMLLTRQGRCFVWGRNARGQLGLGDSCHRKVPEKFDLTCLQLAPEDSVAQIIPGLFHTILFSRQGRCFVWGLNGYGQLGLGDDVNRNIPVEFNLTLLQLAPGDGVAQVIVGGHHNILLTRQGRCFVWGFNGYGQLGLGDDVNRYVSVELDLIRLQLAPEDSVAQIITGLFHTILFTRQGRCFVWGLNGYGQLGLGDNNNRNAPVEFNLSRLQLAPGDGVTQVVSGRDHTILLTRQGRCFVWGSNQFGQLGLGDDRNRNVPVELGLTGLQLASGDGVAQVVAGSDHTILVTRQGRCFVWGSNQFGQLGLGYLGDDRQSISTPTEVFYPHRGELKNVLSFLQKEDLTTLALLACDKAYYGEHTYQLIVKRLASEKIQTRLSVISLIHASPWHQLPQVTELLPFASLYYPLIEALRAKPNKEQQYIASALAKLLDVYHYFLNANTSSEQTHQEDFIELLKTFSLESLKDSDDFDKYLEETASRYLKNFGLTVLGCSVDSAVPNLATRFIDMCQELLTAAKQQPELLSHLKTAADILLQGLNAATEVDGLAHTLRAFLQPKEQLRPTRPGAGFSS